MKDQRKKPTESPAAPSIGRRPERLPARPEKRRRGRPRAFDEKVALDQATGVFHRAGLAGASLDDLTQAMGINKPSLYGAFGDKRALFEKAVFSYGDMAKAFFLKALASGDGLENAARAFLVGALDLYAPVDEDHLGCFVMITAVAAAGDDATLRSGLHRFIADADQVVAEALEARFSDLFAVSAMPAIDVARWLNATLHSLAVRARTDTSREDLERFAEVTARTIARAVSAENTESKHLD